MTEHDSERADALYLEAVERWESDGTSAARPLLEQALVADPDHPDVHHALAICFELEGDFDQMVKHFLETRRLDERYDEELGIGDPENEGHGYVADLAEGALASIPEKFRRHLENVPIVLEPRPAKHLVAEGFDPRSLGLFEGAPQGERDDPRYAPTRIVVYYANLLAEFDHPEAEPEDLAEQIEITLLHEVAHFFGLEEDEVAALGLE